MENGMPPPGRAGLSAVMESIHTHSRIARTFLSDERFRDPVLVIWVASFGSALHAPVTTYYLLEVGATHMDIGWVGFIASLGSLVCGPLYGALLDKKGSLPAIVTAAVSCAVGCLIRGLAPDPTWLYVGYLVLGVGAENLWTLVLSHLSRHTENSGRSLVISGYLFQVTALKILGKFLYPAWNFILEDLLLVTDTLPRMRIHMGMCTAFCFFGVLRLVANWNIINDAVARNKTHVTEGGGLAIFARPPAATPNPSITASAVATSGGLASAVAGGGGGACQRDAGTELSCTGNTKMPRFVLFAMLLVLQSVAVAISNTLWPLFLKDQYNWTTKEFAPLLFVASVCGTACVALAPVLLKRYGESACLLTGSLLGAVCAVVCFQFQNGGPWSFWMHSATFVGLFTALSFLEPGIKTCASVSMPQLFQGTSFGMLTSLSGFGFMVGSPLGTHLYTISRGYSNADLHAGVAGATHSYLASGGSLPMTVTAGLLFLSALLLAIAMITGVIPTRLASGTPRGKLRVSPPQERKRDEVHVTFADSAA